MPFSIADHDHADDEGNHQSDCGKSYSRRCENPGEWRSGHQNFADEIGADGYAPDAGSATKLVKSLKK